MIVLAVPSSCEDSLLQKTQRPIGRKTTAGGEGNQFTLEYLMDRTTERPLLFLRPTGQEHPPTTRVRGGQHLSLDDGADRFGGIRLVSVTPRIIGLYLAVPNLNRCHA